MLGAYPSPHGDWIVHRLKDGYWESTYVAKTSCGALVVRKEAKPAASGRPWALGVLRAEIDYLERLPLRLREVFPPLLRAWGRTSCSGELPGYEIPYYRNARNFAQLIAEGSLAREDALALQQRVADAVFTLVHRPVAEDEKPELEPGSGDRQGFRTEAGLSTHVADVLGLATVGLQDDSRFRPIVRAPEIRINGEPFAGVAASLERILAAREWRERLDAVMVRLHGDLIPENVLWDCQESPGGHEGRIVLIDPVSVAGIWRGHPLFDLVKYETFASGVLYAVRHGKISAGPVRDGRPGDYEFRLWDRHPGLKRLVAADLVPPFRAAYVARHGPIDSGLSALLEGYFALVMALNTEGNQQWARVLEGARTLHRAAAALAAA